MNSLEMIVQYLPKTLDTVFAEESKTNLLVNGNKFINLNFDQVGYVKIMNLLMDGLSDYHRGNSSATLDYEYVNGPYGDGYKAGSVDNSWEIYRLNVDRGKQFRLDNMDNNETAGAVLGNLMTEFFRTKVVPETDAYRFAKLSTYAKASLGNRVSETVNANEIIGKFNGAFEWLTEHEVPAEDQIIYVNPDIMTKIRNTTELAKRLMQKDLGGDVKTTIETYEGRPIIVVPSNRFFTEISLCANGFQPTSTAKTINYMVVSKRCCIPVVKLEKSKIFTPEVVQDFDGYKINFRMFHDIFVPKNKIAGIYVSVSNTSASTKASTLAVGLTKTETGINFDEYYTNPAGLRVAKIVYSTAAIAIGATYASAVTNKVITVGDEFTKLGSETKAYFVAVDANNLVIATSAQITLPTE